MIKLFTSSLLFFLVAFTLNAQINSFEKAYIVQNQDTIRGYIKAGSDLDLSRSIQFKTDPQSETVTEYTPNNVTAFGFENSASYYTKVRAEILKGTSIYEVERFAKLLASGYTNLYKLQIPEEEQSNVTVRDNTFIYVLQKDTTFYTLGLYETEDGIYASKDKRYIGMLSAAFFDCNNHGVDIQRLSFNDNSIIGAVSKYNACKDPALKTTVYEYKAKPFIKHGIEASFIKLYIPKSNYDVNGKGFSAGYFWDVMQPGASRKYSTKIGVTYMYYQLPRENTYSELKNQGVHYVRVPFSVQYNLKDPIISETVPFLNVGFTAQLTPDARYRDYIPLPSIGFGTYTKHMRYAVLLENEGFSISSPKIINFTIGVRLDK